jgi:hypothetical protein
MPNRWFVVTGLCRTGKVGYSDEPTALKGLDRIRAETEMFGSQRKTPVRAYMCERCAEWHLTSKPLGRKGAV